MMGRNFLGNNTAVHAADDQATGTDASVRYNATVVDMAANGAARRITALLKFGTVSNAAAVVDLVLQTRPGTTGDWRTLGTITATPKANSFVGIEADTNSAQLDRYMRLGIQRKTHNSQTTDLTFILGDLRNPGTIAVGGIAGGGVVSEKSPRS